MASLEEALNESAQEQYDQLKGFMTELKKAGLYSHPGFNRIWNVLYREWDARGSAEHSEVGELYEDMFSINEYLTRTMGPS